VSTTGSATTGAGEVRAFGVGGIGEVNRGDDLAGLIVEALLAQDADLLDGDLVVVASKVVSKAEGRTVASAAGAADQREAAVGAQTVRVVAERTTPRGTTRIVQSRSGPVLAAAGVDASNVAPGTVLLLPADPDASARALRQGLYEYTGRRLAVLVTDTLGRPWRDGQVDAAIGAAGTAVVDDLRGAVDGFGTPLEVTVRALADEIAGLADLVKGKLDGVPVAVVRGLGHLVLPADEDGPGAAVLLRPAGQDWFRYGHVEAVRSSLGTGPGTPGAEPAPVAGGTAAQRLQRAVDVALASAQWPSRPGGEPPWVATVVEDPSDVLPDAGGSSTDPGAGRTARVAMIPGHGATAWELMGLGALAQRVLALAWSEGLDAVVVERFYDPDPAIGIRAVLRP